MRGPNRGDLNALNEAMKARNLDAVITVLPENFYYISGSLIMTSWEIRDRLALAVFPVDEEPTAIVCNIEEGLVRDESWIKDVRPFVEFANPPIEVLADVLQERGLANKRVGIELSYLAASYYLRLKERLPGLELVSSEELFEKLVAIKTSEEVAQLKFAANVTEQAIYEVFASSHLGSTEKEMADQMNSRQLVLGADVNAFMVLGLGENIFNAHVTPGNNPLGEGDLVRLDIGSSFDGYYSDVARMAVGGKPNARQVELYKLVRGVQRATIAMMKPGVRACDVFNYCVKSFEEKGLSFASPHIGHGLGIGLHEYPMIEPANTDELKAGMVINIEPFYMDRSVGCFHIEDLVHVTDEGPVLISDYSDTEELYCIR